MHTLLTDDSFFVRFDVVDKPISGGVMSSGLSSASQLRLDYFGKLLSKLNSAINSQHKLSALLKVTVGNVGVASYPRPSRDFIFQRVSLKNTGRFEYETNVSLLHRLHALLACIYC